MGQFENEITLEEAMEHFIEGVKETAREKVQIKRIDDDEAYTENEVYTYVYLGDIEGRVKVKGKWTGR